MTAATGEMANPQSMWEPMQHSGFRRFFAAAVVSNAGSWMQSVAVPFTVFEITNSKTWLGISAFTGMFVGMLANAPGGMLADRYARRKVLIATQTIQLFSAVSLLLLWSFGQPTIAVDTHIFRVANRMGLAPGKTPDEVERKLVRFVPDEFKLHAHHWLILHGRYVCVARKPVCGQCTLHDLCEYRDKAA